MSQEKVEAIMRVVDAFNRGDPHAFVACCAADVDWEENTPVYPGLRPHYRGLEQAREWFEEAILDVWDDFHVEPELKEMIEAPKGQVLFPAVITGRGRASGVETRLRLWTLFTLEQGKVKRRRLFRDRDATLAAAGLSEQSGSPTSL